MNIRVGRSISVRPVEVNYLLTRIRDPILDNARNQNNLRYSAGVSILFGGEKRARSGPKP